MEEGDGDDEEDEVASEAIEFDGDFTANWLSVKQ